ncbi:MAG: ATP-binding cassette domain-containing protein, partial [Acidimicrobiales bacterium]
MTTATAPSARLIRASKAFGGVPVLRSVDLELWPGEVHALIGQNGAGKTTLVKLLAGAIAPDSGTVEVAGHRLRP